MPYKGGVQLLPETARRPTLASYTSGNAYFYFAVALAAAVLVISAIFNSYSANLNDQIAKLDGRLDQTEAQRNRDEEQGLISAAKQSRLMRQLLGGKIYWSQALTRMEQMTQSGVQLENLSASATKGTIGFRALADGYASVARQLAAFVSGTGITDISLKSVKAAPQGGVEFDGELKIDTRAMLNKSPAKKP